MENTGKQLKDIKADMIKEKAPQYERVDFAALIATMDATPEQLLALSRTIVAEGGLVRFKPVCKLAYVLEEEAKKRASAPAVAAKPKAKRATKSKKKDVATTA